MTHEKKAAKVANEQRHPGAGFTQGRDKAQDIRLEKQYTCRLNNNPRNDGNQI